jgi:endonuclease G
MLPRMRALFAAIALAAVPAIVLADPSSQIDTTTRPGFEPVIGGSDAPDGTWPDLAAVLTGSTGDTQVCTGTLIAPTVVITAGHCYLTSEGPLPTHVLIGTNSLAANGGGTVIKIDKGYVYPNSQESIDVTALVLDTAATQTPRAIATGWAKLEIQNSAMITIAGYGSTDDQGNVYPTIEQQATTTITDFDCSTSDGCNAAAKPDGELGAGGSGIDTCPGDSGGPLYLPTSFGTFLAGVTSRAYDDASAECGAGGIYERPDKIVPWIEQQTGVTVAHAPEPTADPLMMERGSADETMITANDPNSTSHTYAIKTQPMNGSAAVRADGTVRMCADPGVAGSDAVVVTVTDATNPARAVDMTIPVTIADTTSPASSCDANAFGSGTGGGGCCDSGGGAPGTAIPLAIALAALLGRRRLR